MSLAEYARKKFMEDIVEITMHYMGSDGRVSMLGAEFTAALHVAYVRGAEHERLRRDEEEREQGED